jgi:monoamine oxidase
MSDPDVIVIGAGAAGLGAAQRLAAAGLAVHVIEARDRLGGRAWTSRDPATGLPIELGCAWLHSADENELAGLATKAGLTIDQTRPPWRSQMNNIGFSPDDQADFRAALERLFGRLDKAGEAAADSAADRFLEPGNRWNPLLNATSSYMNGVELDQLSVIDFWRYHDTGVNWRISEGYSSLMAAMAAGLAVTFACPVHRIDHSGALVRAATARGDLRARAVVVTVSTDVLCSCALQFHPALPDKLVAASALPLGLADKLYLRLDGAEEFSKDSHLYGALDTDRTASYHMRPFGRPLIEVYFGGRFARELEGEGEAAFASFAIGQLVSVLGGAIRNRLHPVAATAWGKDPYALGSYSHAQPGHADARAVLAQSVDARLFFAGEACSVRDFSTAHGAYRSGRAAADDVIAALARAASAP